MENIEKTNVEEPQTDDVDAIIIDRVKREQAKTQKAIDEALNKVKKE